MNREKEKADGFAFGIGARLVEAEKERGAGRARDGFVTVKIPKQGLAGCADVRIFLRAPKRPYLRVIALDAFALGKIGFEDGEDLKAGAAIVVALVSVERPKIAPALECAGGRVFLHGVGIEEKEDAHA